MAINWDVSNLRARVTVGENVHFGGTGVRRSATGISNLNANHVIVRPGGQVLVSRPSGLPENVEIIPIPGITGPRPGVRPNPVTPQPPSPFSLATLLDGTPLTLAEFEGVLRSLMGSAPKVSAAVVSSLFDSLYAALSERNLPSSQIDLLFDSMLDHAEASSLFGDDARQALGLEYFAQYAGRPASGGNVEALLELGERLGVPEALTIRAFLDEHAAELAEAGITMSEVINDPMLKDVIGFLLRNGGKMDPDELQQVLNLARKVADFVIAQKVAAKGKGGGDKMSKEMLEALQEIDRLNRELAAQLQEQMEAIAEAQAAAAAAGAGAADNGAAISAMEQSIDTAMFTGEVRAVAMNEQEAFSVGTVAVDQYFTQIEVASIVDQMALGTLTPNEAANTVSLEEWNAAAAGIATAGASQGEQWIMRDQLATEILTRAGLDPQDAGYVVIAPNALAAIQAAAGISDQINQAVPNAFAGAPENFASVTVPTAGAAGATETGTANAGTTTTTVSTGPGT